MLKPADKEELKKIIENRIHTDGPKCDLNDIDVSGITDMSELFKGSQFNGDISEWNVSEQISNQDSWVRCNYLKKQISTPDVRNKNEMLREIIDKRIKRFGSKCDLNNIDVSGLTDMSDLFKGSKFNGDISKWDVSNVTNMSGMFCESNFTGDISKWDVSKVTNMCCMFLGSEFTRDTSNWNIRHDCDTTNMFGKNE